MDGSDLLNRFKYPLIILGILAFIGYKSVEVVPVGHVKVATIFGKVVEQPYTEGIHVVNPLYKFTLFDGRQKTHKETAAVPSQDQLTTRVDLNVQYRLNKQSAPQILKETGDLDNLIRVHMIPKIRSLVREQGKTIPRAEDFFKEETQQILQANLLEGLKEYAEPKGLIIQAILLRDVNLPEFIVKAIESKKEREQAAEKQKAELERFKTEQAQKVATAEAEFTAANTEAKRKKVLADAQAYEIKRINEAISNSPGYIKLQALEALKAISKDESSKIYFINGDSPNPLPLMHMGDK